MTGDTVLLIGLGDNKVCLNTATLYTIQDKIEKDYGTDSFFTEAWKVLNNLFDADQIYVLNLDSWDDLQDQEDLLQQNQFTYIVPLGLYLNDSYHNIFEDKQYYYSQLLAWMAHGAFSTIIFTGKHASGFTTLTEYLDYEKQVLDEVAPSFQNLERENVIYVGNCLNAYPYANVIVAGMLLGDVGEYPTADNLYEARFDIDWCDVPFDLVFFRNGYLTGTTVENLMNFSSDPFRKPVTVDRILKYIRSHWPDMSQFIGTAFTQYKMAKIYEIADTFLASLVDWILYKYQITGMTSVQNQDGTVSIHISYDIWPHFTTEKFSDEVIL